MGILTFEDGSKTIGCTHPGCRTMMSKPYVSLKKGPAAIPHVFCWVSGLLPSAPAHTQ